MPDAPYLTVSISVVFMRCSGCMLLSLTFSGALVLLLLLTTSEVLFTELVLPDAIRPLCISE